MLFAELPPAPPILEAPHFDLEQIGRQTDRMDFRTIRPRCPVGSPGEIVVCAPDPEKERARRLAETYAVAESLPRAEIDIGDGVILDIRLDAGVLANGYIANRVMAGVKFKF